MRNCLALLCLLLLTACGLGETIGSKSGGSGGPTTGITPIVAVNQAQIEVHAMEPTINEGKNARFRIGWYGKGPEPESDLTVNLSVTQSGEYSSASLSSITSIALTEDNEFRDVLEIGTQDDSVVEYRGKISVELLQGEGYSIYDFKRRLVVASVDGTLLEGENLALGHVNVLDNEPPRIDIHSMEPTISEGGIARFKIGWFGFGVRPEPGLKVNLYVFQTGRFTNAFPSSITLFEEDGTEGVLEIPTIDDGIAERNGKIIVKLLPGQGYVTYNSNVSWRSNTPENWGITFVDVLDNDQPRISVSPQSYSVVEGKPARFVIKSDANVPTSDLTVNISTHLAGDFFPQPAPTEFVLKAGRQSGVLSIPTVADTDVEENGGVTVSIKSGSGYVLADLIHTYASVTIIGDNVPTIWAEALRPTIFEGDVAEFTIGTETGALTEDTTVNISVTRNGGDFLDNTDSPNFHSINTFLLAEGKVSDKLTVSTFFNDVIESDWRLGLQILVGDGYQLSDRRIAYTDVIDDDLPVWIETPKSEIYEGDVAGFLLGIGTGDSPQIADRTVNLNVSQTGDFITGELPATIKLRAGKRSEVLELPTVYDDSSVSGEGSITVEILPGVGYAVAGKSSATVTVKDRETQQAPTLLVAAIREEIDEGQPALFRIVADVSRLVSPLTVHFTIQEKGDFLDPVHTQPLPLTFKMEPGRTFLGRAAGTHGYSTEDDDREERHGSIAITLQNSAGYKVMQEHGTATVKIRDNDGSNFRPNDNDSTPGDNDSAPRIGISSVLDSVVHGLEMPFRITSATNRLLPEELTVTLNVRQIYSLQDIYEYSRDVVLEGNQRSEDINLSFVPADFNVGSDGVDVEVIIVESEEYEVHAGQGKAGIRVVPKSQDQYSVFGFVQDVNFVSEGETAKIGVTITNNTVGFIVKMKVTEIGEFLNFDIENGMFDVTVPPNISDGAYMPIPIPENDTYEGDGSVTFEVLTGFGYHVDEQHSTTILHIRDNDKPEVFLESATQHVHEGEHAVFEIGMEGEAFAESGEELEIFLSVTQQGGFLLNAPPDSFILGAGQGTGYLRLETEDDLLNEVNGFVTVEIDVRSGSNYSIRQGFGQATLEIRDNDPDWTVYLNKLSGYVFEGATANFEISRDGTEFVAELNVSLKISTVGDFLVSAPPESFIIGPGSETGILSLETRNDELTEQNGEISVEVLPGPGYILHENFKKQTVEIRDRSQPLPVFVAKLIYYVYEGESAGFLIGSEDAPASRDLEILLDVSDPQGFLSKEAPESFSLKKGMYTGQLELETEDDKIIESDGWVSVRILPGAGYQPIADSSADSVRIRDNEPKPSIHVRALSQTAFAGEIAEFEIGTTGDAPVSDLSIRIWVERQVGQFSYGSFVNWVLPKGRKSNFYRRSSSTGQMTVSILGGTGYAVSDAESAATVNFVTKPAVYVAGGPSVVEGQPLSFRISRRYSSALETTVNIKVSQFAIRYPYFALLDPAGRRSLIGETPPESVVIPESEEFVTLTFNTIDDDINGFRDVSFGVGLEILEGTGYNYNEGYGSRFASIGIIDNDPNPELSIEALGTEVGKGDTARFRIAATIASYDDLHVGLELWDSGNLTVDPAVTGVVLEAGTKFVEFDVSTDENANGQGSFSVHLLQANEYRIDGQLRTATVQVYDWPMIGVEPAQGTQVTEGGQAAFRLISRENRPVPLNVSYTVSQSEISGTRTLTESFSAGQGSRTFQVSTEDDDIYTHVSRVSVELQPGRGYRVSDQYHRVASVSISDNDKPAISVESKLNGSIVEGDKAVFAVSATRKSSTDLQINLRVEDSGGRFLLQPRTTATLPAGRTSAHFSVQTYTDTMSDSDGRVTVEVVEGLGYDVALPQFNSAGINISNIARPLLFLVREMHSVRRGEDAVFTVKAVTATDNGSIRSVSLANDLTINVYRIRSLNQASIGDFANWTLPAGQGSVTVRIPSGNWNSITIGLTENSEGAYGLYARYEVAATVTVINETDDDGSDARVSIMIADPDPVVEGTGRNPVFRLTSDKLATSDLTVNLGVTGALNFVETGGIPDSIVLKAGSDIAIVEIPIHDDEVDDADGEILVEILNPTQVGDYAIGTPGTAKVGVRDDEAPPTVSIAGSASAVEGPNAKAVFTFTASRAASTDRKINLSVSGASEFLPSSGMPKFVVLSRNETTATIELEIVDDDIDESSDVLTVTILPPASVDDYWVGDANSAWTAIEDNDDPPVLTIAGENVVAEGGGSQALFTVTASRMTDSDRTVRISVADAAGVVDLESLPETVVLSRKSLTTIVALPIDESSVSPDDSVSMQILSPAVAGHYSVGSTSTAAVNVYVEAEVPQITISDAPAVTEGTDTHAIFPIAVTIALTAETTINVTVSGATNFIGPGSVPATARIPPGSLNATLEIPIHDDNVDEANGTINVSIPDHSSSLFTVGEANAASVSVADDDAAPSISISVPSPISLGKGKYIEGTHSKAVIEFAAEGLASTSRTINIGVSKQSVSVGDFFSAANFTTTATLNALSDSATLDLNILDDDIEENEATYSVNILPPTNEEDYRQGTVKHYQISVSDNDSNPEMSISGGADAVEGTDSHAVFTIKSSKLTNATRQINLSVTGAVNFITQGLTPAYVEFPSGTKEATLRIPIHDDNDPETNGAVNVEITEHTTGNPYGIGTNSSATVNVWDNDAPLISITGPASFVEGSSSHIEFTLSATTMVASNLTVQLSVTGTVGYEGFLAPNHAFPSSTVFAANNLHSQFLLPIHDDEVEDSSSIITVTVSPPGSEGGYAVGTPEDAEVHVLDDESTSDWPVVSIAPNHEPQTFVVGTDSSIDFTLNSSKPIQSGLNVKVSVTGATGFLSSLPRSIVFSSGTHKNFSLQIHDDNVYEDPGSITVTVLGPFIDGGYLVSNQKSAQVAIRDKPVISVLHADPVAIVGLNSFIHVLYKSDWKSSSPRTVNLSVTGALNFLVAGSIPDSFEFPAHRTNYTLQIPVKDGDVEESKGVVKVTILEASNSEYYVGSNKESSTDVLSGFSIESPVQIGDLHGSANDGSSNTQESLGTLIDDQPDSVPVGSISAKLPVIQEGSVAEFQISVSQVSPADLKISLTIEIANGSDVETSQDTVILLSGKKTVSYAVRTLDDRLAGVDRTISVGITVGDGYETDDTANVAVVRVSDEIDRTRRDGIVQANSVVLPALLERIGSGPLSTAFRRVEQSFAGNTRTMKVGGQDSLKDMILKGGKLANDADISWDSLLDGSSFNVPVNSQDGIAENYSVWGAGERHIASQREDSFKWNGDLMMGQIGFDTQFNEEYLAGLSVTRSEIEATFDSNEGSVLEYDADSTGLYPYFGWESIDRNSQIQVAAGYSEGGIIVNQDGFEPYFMDSSLFSAGISGNSTLFANEVDPSKQTSELNLVGEAWFARQNLDGQFGYLEDKRLESGYSRMAVESVNKFNVSTGGSFQPTASIGVLGRIGSGFGFELGSSMSYVNPIGLDVSAEGRSFLATDGWERDVVLSGRVEFDKESDGLGLILSLSPVWNHNSANGQNSIWTSEVSEFGTATVQFGTSSQFNAKIGYGFDLWSHAGVLTPFGKVGLTESVRNEFALGSQYESDSGLDFGVEWSGTNSFDSGASQAVKVKSSLKW